jgi:carbon-monoxide dehydrogenase medium subunit/6-hydroxypseudooxynicotine dehydrogenase subunit alpha
VKPPPFVVQRPATLTEALDVLAELGDTAKPIAGGQSLYPLLALRFARPETLVDLTALADPELRAVSGDQGQVSVGALVPHVMLRRDPLFQPARWSALREASRHIGHYPIQVRGTIGGSLAHADPSAELCALALLFDAEFHVASAAGTRVVGAGDWLDGPFQTALAADELLTRIVFRSPMEASSAFAEVAPRPGDFALASAALLTAPGAAGGRETRVVVGGAAGGPRRCLEAERLLASFDGADRDATAAAVGDAAADAVAAAGDDSLQRQLVNGLVRRQARIVLA